MKSLAQYIKDKCEYLETASFRSNYSGRGMYGKSCVGISGSTSECNDIITDIIIDMYDDKYDDFRNAVKTLLSYSTDNMGYGIIMYWPDLQFEDEDSGEE